jgi:hypothetical protein
MLRGAGLDRNVLLGLSAYAAGAFLLAYLGSRRRMTAAAR